MSRRETYEDKTWELLQPILKELGLIPVDVEFVREGSENYLRIYIDKEGGIGINDCEEVSRRIDPLLDENDFIDDPYILEVSSPGLGRRLKRPRDFEYGIGREVEMKSYRPIDGKKEFKGILKAADKDTITVVIGENETVFAKKDLSLVKLTFEL